MREGRDTHQIIGYTSFILSPFFSRIAVNRLTWSLYSNMVLDIPRLLWGNFDSLYT